MEELKVSERARKAANDFLREDRARRYERARSLSEFERRAIDEAEALGNFARDRDDRTFCILVGSFMEDTFKENFIEQWSIKTRNTADFFGANGPLSTFSQRLIIASGLDWLPPALQKDAGLIRKIRNEMAHNHRVHALSQEPLLSWANEMEKVEETWINSDNGRYADAYDGADIATRLRVRLFSQSVMVLASVMTAPRLIQSSLPPGYREDGWEGLTDLTKALIDVMIRQAYFAFGISPSDDDDLAQASESPVKFQSD